MKFSRSGGCGVKAAFLEPCKRLVIAATLEEVAKLGVRVRWQLRLKGREMLGGRAELVEVPGGIRLAQRAVANDGDATPQGVDQFGGVGCHTSKYPPPARLRFLFSRAGGFLAGPLLLFKLGQELPLGLNPIGMLVPVDSVTMPVLVDEISSEGDVLRR